MSKKETYEMFFSSIERDVYSCKKCKIKSKYSMQKFNKEYKKEFEKRFEEIWSWHIKSPDRPIFLGCINRLRNIVLGKKVYNDPFNDKHYRFKGYRNYNNTRR